MAEVGYDPRLDGARCDECPLRSLREGGPIKAKWHERAQALLVGEAPGAEEVKKGEPFVGKAGIELEKSLRSVGASRGHLALTNAIACRPPDNELSVLLHRLQKENKRRVAEGLEPRPTPMECCRPRLLSEMAALPNVIAVGKVATEAVTGHVVKIMSARGGPVVVPHPTARVPGREGPEPLTIRILPTLHPAFVMRSRRWAGAFRADLARAFRWFTSGLAWKEPRGLYRPSPAQFDAFLTSLLPEAFSVFDVETTPGFPAQDHFDPMWDQLRCIGIGTASGWGCVVPFRSVIAGNSFYTPPEQIQIVRSLKEYLTSSRWKKAGWNSRAYDRQVLEYRLGVVPSPHLDAIGLHKLAEPELPHDLGYAGSVHTDVDKWKAGHVAVTARTDMELWSYCVKDAVVSAMTVEPLRRACAARSQLSLLPFFAKLQDVCVGLHQNGMYVNQAIRREWDRKLLGEAARLRKQVRELAGWKDLNPSSFPQVADLLFDRLGIAPHHYTDLGDPSTDDDALRAFLSETWGLPERARAIVRTIRAYRKTVKRRGVVVRLRPITEEYYEEPFLVDFEESEEEREERERRAKKGKGERAPGLVLPDGRVHANWLAHGTWGWRFSCNGPNMQNWEDRLRDMVEAAPGHVLVACDESQLELRMVVGLSKCRYYMEQFDSGGDPHKSLCLDTFGAGFDRAEADQKKRLRRAVKELTYSGLYVAGAETQLEVVTSAEDEDEELIFPDFTLREVSAFRDNWHRRCPEIAAWWDSILAEYRRDHFLTEPIMGLRCDFLDGEDPNKLTNFKPQAGGAALAHKALFRALDELPKAAGRAPGAAIWGEGTGLVQQGHDSVVFELPAEHGPWKIEEKRNEKTGQIRLVETFCAPDCTCSASRLARLLEASMAEDGAKYGLPVKFAGEAHVGRSWKGV